MPNTQSAEKALRNSIRKKAHNLFWKSRFKKVIKSLNKGFDSNEKPEFLMKKLDLLQKMLDKAAKEKVIHKNKANRLKSRYAKKIAALDQKTSKSSS